MDDLGAIGAYVAEYDIRDDAVWPALALGLCTLGGAVAILVSMASA